MKILKESAFINDDTAVEELVRQNILEPLANYVARQCGVRVGDENDDGMILVTSGGEEVGIISLYYESPYNCDFSFKFLDEDGDEDGYDCADIRELVSSIRDRIEDMNM